MRSLTAVADQEPETGLLSGDFSGFPGVRSQSETLDEPNDNLPEVISMRRATDEPHLEADFLETQSVAIL